MSEISAKLGCQHLPDLIFGEIMMMLGLEEIHKCRQVCKSWNVMINQTTKYKKNTIRRQAESLAVKIRDKLAIGYPPITPQLPLNYQTLAILAHHGILSSVQRLIIDEDLASVKHLASLASCVTGSLIISHVNSDLITILDNIQCERELVICNQSVNSEMTQALVRAMESRVEWVTVGPKTSLDLDSITQYSGKGKCKAIKYYFANTDRFGEECPLETMGDWARRNNWGQSGAVIVNEEFTVHYFIRRNMIDFGDFSFVF